jgi:catechol 2,3-dioxygenase-like lactoylglutathione lyase family enzyme
MITGAHIVVYSKNAEADRAFFHDVLGLKSVDAGHGWLIFAMPPAEAAFHPSEEGTHELYFMCDDLKAEMALLGRKGVKCSNDNFYVNHFLKNAREALEAERWLPECFAAEPSMLKQRT